MLLSVISYGQARSSIGFGAGINKTLSSNYDTGYGYNMQGSIRLSDKFALVPVLGIEQLKNNTSYIYEGYSRYALTQGIIYFGINGKYYLSQPWFVRAGTMLYLGTGGGDINTGGFGGNLALGYDLPVSERSDFEITLRTDIAQLRSNTNKLTPIIGLRLAYNFNFRAL